MSSVNAITVESNTISIAALLFMKTEKLCGSVTSAQRSRPFVAGNVVIASLLVRLWIPGIFQHPKRCVKVVLALVLPVVNTSTSIMICVLLTNTSVRIAGKQRSLNALFAEKNSTPKKKLTSAAQTAWKCGHIMNA